MNFDYFDIHSHLTFPQYDADREDVIRDMTDARIGTITVGTDLASSKAALALAEEHDHIFACIGVHPADGDIPVFDSEFSRLAVHPKAVALGECGLDYFRLEGDAKAEKQRQKEIFEAHIALALETGKPLMIHCRNAYEDTLSILESYAKREGERLSGNAHFFAGGAEIGKRFLAINFSLSFTGVITFARDYDESIRMAPLEMILSETDAPYVAPVPHRGKRNSPLYVPEVAHTLATIRGEEVSIVKEALVKNTLRRFSLLS